MGQGKGYGEGAGVPVPTWLSRCGECRKRTDLVEGLRRLREAKAASGKKGARGRCGGWQRGYVRLRRVEALGREMAFCACVGVGLLARFLTAPGRGRVLETPVRVR